MKKILILAVLALCAGMTSLHADQPTYGNITHGKETIDSIRSYGVVTLDGTKVLGPVQIDGKLIATNVIFNSLQIKGLAKLKQCVVQGVTEITGALFAEQTQFQKEIVITSHEISFSGCTLESIMVRKDADFQATQIIDARNGTKINGSVSFESGYGEIWLSSDSSVMGQVTGGQIVKK